jgi:methylated-DNA-protein-cysteine methyltransferase-like protein
MPVAPSSGGRCKILTDGAGLRVVTPSGSTHQRIYATVKKIPKGRVTTYGTVARLAGFAGQARLVGYALSALPAGTALPWHRVINAQGRLSLERSSSGAGVTQRLRLEAEGVKVDAGGRVSLVRYGWRLTETKTPRTRAI